MISDLNKNTDNKKDAIAYFITVLVVLISARANILFYIKHINEILLLLIFPLFFLRGKTINKKFIVFSFFYFIFSFFIAIKLHDYKGVLKEFFSFYLGFILLSYVILKVTGKKFFQYYEDIIYKLALISLPLYILQLLIPHTFFTINKFLQSTFKFLDTGGAQYSNSFIFTFRDPHWMRNCGFMWEPGAFGAVLALAAIFNLIFNKFRANFKLLIIIIAMLTTISTTAYINLVILFSFWVINTAKVKNIIIFLSFISIIGIIGFQTEFGYKKVLLQLDSIEKDMMHVGNSIINNSDSEGLTLDRFASLVYDFQFIQDNYIIGIGLNDEELNNYGSFTRTNGLSDYIVKFGLVGLFFLIINMNKSFRLISEHNKVKGSAIFIILIISISFSNPILLTILFISLQLFYLTKTGIKKGINQPKPSLQINSNSP
ncbi:MAG: hypothetical protein Q8880_08590 [Bacteroidota bacterium]|nr:hypothetical protein [Bacteroidota bacterium]